MSLSSSRSFFFRVCRWALSALTLTVLAHGIGCSHEQRGGVPEEVVQLNILGTAYLGQQKWAEAEASFRKALQLRPEDPLLLTNTAVALVQLRRTDEAQQLLQRALEVDPDYPFAHYNLGLLHEATGEYEQAAAHFQAVARLDPDDLFTQYYLGTTLSRIGRTEDAELALRSALRRDPTHISSLYGLGRLLLKKGEQEEGTRLITLSQQIRARSGLDQTVGGQYGEQGPYAMGIDYTGQALAAPAPIAVRFDEVARVRTEAPRDWTLAPMGARGEPVLILAAGKRISGLSASGPVDLPFPQVPAGAEVVALAAGDVDNDRRVDLVAMLASAGVLAPAVARQADDGTFAWQADGHQAASSPSGDATAWSADLTLVDLDHDGDLDLFWCSAGAPGGAGCSIATNNGSARFEVRPFTSLGPNAAGPVRVAFSDADNDRDIDLLVARSSALRLFSNQRDGTFEDVSEAAGLGSETPQAASFSVADVNKDGFMDLVVGGPNGVLFLANQHGRFAAPTRLTEAGPGDGAPVILDFDNDGFLDVAHAGAAGITLHRNRGAEGWTELSGQAGPAEPLAAYDADGDGDLDLAARVSEGVVLLSNEGGNVHHWIRLDSRGVGDNRFGIGAKVEVLSGALRQKFEVTAPLPLHVGLGPRLTVQSARYLWPSGVLQDEVELSAGGTVEVAQLDRKGTSCPLLYAWRDGGWRFVTDFLGGCAIGYQHAPGVLNVPDTDEYVRVEGGLTEDGQGRLRLRLNNQLEEVIWFDQVELVVVDHPAGAEVYPNERLMPGPPWPAFKLFASREVRPLARALAVDTGADLTELLRDNDRRSVDDFGLLPFKGYARTHTIELDLGSFPRDQRIVLLLEGWIDYADSTANIAATQAGLLLVPPRLFVADGGGGWTETSGVMGFPAGLPKTMAVELTGLFPSGDHRVRIETNMRIYWDRARALLGGEALDLDVRRLQPLSAELRFGGYPRETSPDGRAPYAYDPQVVSAAYPWKAHIGAYSAFGDVTRLLAQLDDRFVTTRHGDEIELLFRSPGPPGPGRGRTFLLFADGFGKDMDPNSAASDAVGPVPFHAMPIYPYPPDVAPPARAEEDSAPPRWVLPSPAGWPGAVPQALVSRREAGVGN